MHEYLGYVTLCVPLYMVFCTCVLVHSLKCGLMYVLVCDLKQHIKGVPLGVARCMAAYVALYVSLYVAPCMATCVLICGSVHGVMRSLICVPLQHIQAVKVICMFRGNCVV